MRIAKNLRLSLQALAVHRLRAALAVAGAAVGVAGVVALTAVGTGARNAVIRRIEALGRNMIVITPAQADALPGRARQGEGSVQNLRLDDAHAILRGSAAIRRAAPALDRGMSAKFGRIMTPVTVLGTTPDWRAIRQFDIAQGRFFTDDENAARVRVAVLGADARNNLFPDSVDPVGRTIMIGRVPFQVVGVLVSKGVSVGGSATEDDRIVVPLETARFRLFNVDYLKTIYLEATDAARMMAAEREAADILRARHELTTGQQDDFVVQNQRVLLATELAAQSSFQRLIMGLGFLALLVGGAGILSILLLSARERRAEIGLRVAVGARRRDIVTQFLLESLTLALAGGLLGILLGGAGSVVLSIATRWDAHVSATTLLIASTSTLALGLACGVIPAWRAASLDPAVALTE